jgi:hypothetical protein
MKRALFAAGKVGSGCASGSGTTVAGAGRKPIIGLDKPCHAPKSARAAYRCERTDHTAAV